jgi:hypothetical protein
VSRLLALALALALAGCDLGAGEPEPARPDRSAIDALVAFARDPGDATWRALPLASEVALGLGDTVRARRSASALRDPDGWVLNVDLFRARAGTASALELIDSEDGELRVLAGPHRHCAAAPVPPPPEAAGLSRIAVQPREPDGCLDWWTVDVFLDGEGKITVVTLDLWEP